MALFEYFVRTLRLVLNPAQEQKEFRAIFKRRTGSPPILQKMEPVTCSAACTKSNHGAGRRTAYLFGAAETNGPGIMSGATKSLGAGKYALEDCVDVSRKTRVGKASLCIFSLSGIPALVRNPIT